MPSTVIRSFEYDAARHELKIVFQSGRQYHYLDVPPEIAAEMRVVRSKGTYFNERVRDVFQFVAEQRAS